MTTNTPNPSIMARFTKPVVQSVVVANEPVTPTDPGRIVRPGLVPTVTEDLHDGVVKAKHLKPGQDVRPWHSQHGARGSERTVLKVRKITDTDELAALAASGVIRESDPQPGGYVEVSYSTLHPSQVLKSAYRFHDSALAGTPLVKNLPGFVAYQEV